ncbi:type I polyketide synthase, partial [Streptomyces sp. NPDC005963]|uniref:type I polyketide synthase n=1 Tax=Streptomyces sp. NPDC005963 TaxID=3156721 RepID=UPI0033CC8090
LHPTNPTTTPPGHTPTHHPLLTTTLQLAETDEVLFTGHIDAGKDPWLGDHVVMQSAIMPGTAFIELASYAGEQVGCHWLEELTFEAPLFVPERETVRLQVRLGAADEGGRRTVAIHSSADDGPWVRHASGFLGADAPSADFSVESWPPAGSEPIDTDGFYDHLLSRGFGYGPAFQGLMAAWRLGDDVYAEVQLQDDEAEKSEEYAVHPALLDAALHGMAFLPGGGDPESHGTGRLAFSWNDVRYDGVGAAALRVRLRSNGTDSISLEAADETGRPVVSARSITVRPATPEQLGVGQTTSSDSLFQVVWRSLPSVPSLPDSTAPTNWAVLGDDPMGVAEHLRASAYPDFASLATGVATDETVPDAILLTSAARSGADLSGELRSTLARTLTEVQGWLTDERFASTRLVLLTQGAVRTGSDDPAPALVGASSLGLLRSAQSEHPGRIVLVDTDDDPASLDLVGTVLLADEPQLAVRTGGLLAARLDRVALPTDQPDSPLDPDGTVLITGGTGGLGALVARHLVAQHGIRHLHLLSRSGPNAPGATELHDELTAQGVTVHITACDTTNRTELEHSLNAVDPDHPLTAVIHTAGTLHDSTIETLTPHHIDTVLRPKADAALHLHHLTRDHDLAALVLFSSAATTFGAPGQANYAAANAFLDAFAQHHTDITALAWGLWAEERGMGGRLTDADLRRMAKSGTAALSAEEGLGLLDAALTSAESALVPVRLTLAGVRTGDEPVPALLRDLVPTTARRPRSRSAGTARSGGADRLSALPDDKLAEALLQMVRVSTATVLGHESPDAVETELPFKELGFDSLMAVELRNRLNKATGLRLPPTLIFNHPTVAALAAHLQSEIRGASTTRSRQESANPAGSSLVTEADPIAIVSMSCRFPGDIRTPEELWEFVAEGRDAVSGFPTDRGWDLDALYDPDPEETGKSYVRSGGFLSDAGGFDAGFFGISPREALAMDPQQRLLLETSWEAIERAGIEPGTLRGGRVGVFAGTHGQDYGELLSPTPEGLEGYLITGSAASVFSGRVSYTFGLEGPAVTVDTACSSSLVALHLAAQSLRQGECDLALAGAASIMSTPSGLVAFSRQRGLAADGRCKAFADAADGFGMAEGVGMLLLERLSDAQRNGHRVLAVVRGSAVNQDGASNGLTAPNGPSQERVIRQALANARLTPQDIDTVEAHGTGTRLGDPIEAQALLNTYGQDRPGDRPLHLGSVKSNIGHTQAAAGVAGIIKMVKALEHEQLPRTLHVDAPSTQVDWTTGAVELLTEPQDWPYDTDRPRRAGVSSFGVSGTNAHVILEQAPNTTEAVTDTADAVGDIPLLLSGKSEDALRAQARQLATHLNGEDGPALVDVAHALATTRTQFDHRAVILTRDEDRNTVLARLNALAGGTETPGLIQGTVPSAPGKLLWVFPGQGSQWPGMGLHLATESPAFAQRLDECAQALEPHTGWRLHDILDDEKLLQRVDVIQPALWALMVSLAHLWTTHGITPHAVTG